MARNEKLLSRCRALLGEGEGVLGAFQSQMGPNPNLVLFAARRQIVALTNRGFVIMSAGSFLGTKPLKVIHRADRAALKIVKRGYMWAKVSIGGDPYWVHRDWYDVIERMSRTQHHAEPTGGRQRVSGMPGLA